MDVESILQVFLGTILADWREFLHGVWVMIELTVLSTLIGLCLAVPLGLFRLSKNPFVWMPVYGYIFYFRGTPLLVQIFLIYYGAGQFRDVLEGLGLWTYFRAPFFCAVLSLTLNTAAYTAELLRGAIQAVPYGEVDAARACGMSRVLLYRRIILPIAVRIALPAYSNEVVFLLQASSLVSIITVMDITGVARVITARGFAFYEVYLVAAILYMILVFGTLYVFGKIEHRLSGHLRAHEHPKTPELTVHGAT
jgi:His/Glu/Gln/Arg/opine family amino acid ABC transporter permease subunit